MSTDVAEQVRQLAAAFDLFVDEVTIDEAIERTDRSAALGEPAVPRPSRSRMLSPQRYRPEWARLSVSVAAAVMVVGLIVAHVWVDHEAPGPAGAPTRSTATSPSGDAGLGNFVWPAPPRSYATVGELVSGFTAEVLGWTAFDVLGDVSDDSRPQSFTISNGDLDADIAAIAVPSEAGWGFVQIGVRMSASVVGDTSVLEFEFPASVAASSVSIRMIDETAIETSTTSGRVVIADTELDKVASALAIGRDTDGNAVAAAGGQFNVQAPTIVTVPQTLGGAEPVPSGAMVLDQFPDALTAANGYRYVGTAAASPLTADTWVQRWYTATMDRPELGRRLKVASVSSTDRLPLDIPPPGVEASQVTVGGGTAWLYDDPVGSGRSVAFEDNKTVFVLTGYQLGDDELLKAADHTMRADSSDVGAVIDSAVAPAGLVERAVGVASENGFTPLATLQHPPASIRWFDAQADGALPGDGEPMLWLGWTIENPDLLPLHRLDFDTITDATVHGLPAVLATSDDPDYIGIVWSENGHTYTLAGFGLDSDTVLDAANQLRPATDTEWTTLEPEPG